MSNVINNVEPILRAIFLKSVEAVKPKAIFNQTKCFQVLINNTKGHEEQVIRVVSADKKKSIQFDISNKRCHVIGFGKAVLGMAVEVEKVLNKRLVSGLISIPVGTQKIFQDNNDMILNKNSVIKIFEGAINNLPDENAMQAAIKIKELASQMTTNDVLIVLISGGGSALLPLPTAPITLMEKTKLIKQLANRGASINELNTVRIAISDVKGGKLALAARNAHKVISLIISDIINDPIEIIASGPTYLGSSSRNSDAKSILEKYDLWNNLPQSIVTVIEESKNKINEMTNKKGDEDIFIVENNTTAVEAAINEAKNADYEAIVISTSVDGNVRELSDAYYQLGMSVRQFLSHHHDDNNYSKEIFIKEINSLKEIVNMKNTFVDDLLRILEAPIKNGICLIGGGEPTVTVVGHGLGGRNQELSLRFMQKCLQQSDINLFLLSAGTDGIDGPTMAAGAIGSSEILKQFPEIPPDRMTTLINEALANNDSYNFFKNINWGHIITGHTGTNVMDLHILMIPKILQ